MGDKQWTTALVEERLAEAVDVLKRLPEEKVQGYFSSWPEIVRSFHEAFGWHDPVMKRPWPSPASIDRMEVTLTWMQFLAPEDAKLVWARAEKKRWKEICWRFGVTRSTANRRWQYGIAVITLRLNDHRVATRRSIEYVIERARTLSRKNDGAGHFCAGHQNG